MYLNNVLEHVFFENDFPFHLGGKVFTLFTDIFLFYDLSVTGFIKNYKVRTKQLKNKNTVNNVISLVD